MSIINLLIDTIQRRLDKVVVMRDCGVSPRLFIFMGKSSWMPYTLRFCVRDFLSTYVQDALHAGFAGAKTGHKKILVNRNTLDALYWQG